MYGLSKRFAGKPMKPPSYNFRCVPKCQRDLSYSQISEVTNRDDFTDAMSEMVLLCNETLRRQAIAKQKAEEEGTRNGKDGEKAARPPVKTGKAPAKPLSLEYIADRCDVDDPMFGFMVRSKSLPPEAPPLLSNCDSNKVNKKACDNKPNPEFSIPDRRRWKEGMLQGFIIATTFTNWQKTFRWDSIHDSAFSYDGATLASQIQNGQRVCDMDGSLAAELQATCRCGDPYNEGIVWPRIAEISLLGGLGCGKVLLKLMIEKLEKMAPTAGGKQNYDYVVLQATDNSVPFYESMGFVRVGAITENIKEEKPEAPTKEISNDINDPSSKPLGKPEEKIPTLQPREIISSAVYTYTTKNEKIGDIAKKLKCNVWDLIFLNQNIRDLKPTSSLWKGTQLIIPDIVKAKNDACSVANQAWVPGKKSTKKGKGKNHSPSTPGYFKSAAIQWYRTKNNDTTKFIAKKFNLNVQALVAANKVRIEGMSSGSVFCAGTMIKVSGFDQNDNGHIPYCHWTFPDDSDTLDHNEPSYMMVRKLDRKKNKKRKGASFSKPVASSLAVSVKAKYVVPKGVYAPSPKAPSMEGTFLADGGAAVAALWEKGKIDAAVVESTTKQTTKKRKKLGAFPRHPDEPVMPKRPLSAYFHYLAATRDSLKEELGDVHPNETTRVAGERWNALSPVDKHRYKDLQNAGKKQYEEAMDKFKSEMEAFKTANPAYMAQKRLAAEEAASAGDTEGVSKSSPPPKKKKHQHKEPKDFPRNLFNKVVKLTEDGKQCAGYDYEYYYVLTFIPDLFWCHLCPMKKTGNFGLDKPSAKGRPTWILVDETLGEEVDISAGFCKIVDSRMMKNSEDADNEQWDIPDSGPSTLTKKQCEAAAAALIGKLWAKKKSLERHPDEPTRPKKPISSYFHYLATVRPTLKEELPDASLQEVFKTLDERWRALPADDKTVYYDMQQANKNDFFLSIERFTREMEIFARAHPDYLARKLAKKNAAAKFDKALGITTAPSPFTTLLGINRTNEVDSLVSKNLFPQTPTSGNKGFKVDKSVGSSASTTDVASNTVKKSSRKRKRSSTIPRHPDEPFAPKKPLSAYQHYAASAKPTLKEEFAEKSQKEITKMVAERWKAMHADSKSIYENLHNASKEKYEQEMEKYKLDTVAFESANPDYVEKKQREKQAADMESSLATVGLPLPPAAATAPVPWSTPSGMKVAIPNLPPLQPQSFSEVPISELNGTSSYKPSSYVTPTSDAASNKASSKKRRKTKRVIERHSDEPIPPSHPWSAYNHYLRAMRDKMKIEFPDRTAPEVTKIAKERYKTLSFDEKAIYEDMRLAGARKYEVAMENYRCKYEAFKVAFPDYIVQKEKAEELAAAAAEPIRPKNYLNSYNYYLVDTINGVKKEYPGLKHLDASKIVAERWKTASHAERAYYDEKKLVGKREHEIAMDKYNRHCEAYYGTPNLDYVATKNTSKECVSVAKREGLIAQKKIAAERAAASAAKMEQSRSSHSLPSSAVTSAGLHSTIPFANRSNYSTKEVRSSLPRDILDKPPILGIGAYNPVATVTDGSETGSEGFIIELKNIPSPLQEAYLSKRW